MTATHADDTIVPIDLEHLAKYTLGSRDLEGELLALFSGQAPVYVGQMLAAADASAWKNAAHTLKGSARAVGAVSVGREAELLEQSTYSADRAVREKKLETLNGVLREAIAFINSRI